MQSRTRAAVHPHILAVMDETGEDDHVAAVRLKSRDVVEQFHGLFGERPPFNLEALASMRGLRPTDEAPRHSQDSEIAPEADGRVALRLNRARPRTRQRFSIGHEVGHTLFPEYQFKVRGRRALDRTFADPDDLLETLCDVAASEFVFPAPWFADRATRLAVSASALAELANEYQASRDATVRRFVEVHPAPMAAVFFSWKFKPTERRQLQRDTRQIPLFTDAAAGPSQKLRVDYGITNGEFNRCCTNHIPRDKSVPSEGPIHDASIAQVCLDGEMWLNLGSIDGRFHIHVLPIYTPEDSMGPTSGCSVVAVLRPLR